MPFTVFFLYKKKVERRPYRECIFFSLRAPSPLHATWKVNGKIVARKAVFFALPKPQRSIVCGTKMREEFRYLIIYVWVGRISFEIVLSEFRAKSSYVSRVDSCVGPYSPPETFSTQQIDLAKAVFKFTCSANKEKSYYFHMKLIFSAIFQRVLAVVIIPINIVLFRWFLHETAQSIHPRWNEKNK